MLLHFICPTLCTHLVLLSPSLFLCYIDTQILTLDLEMDASLSLLYIICSKCCAVLNHSTHKANLSGNVSTLWTPNIWHSASCLVFIYSRFLHTQLFFPEDFPLLPDTQDLFVFFFHRDRWGLWNKTLFHGTPTSHCPY